MQPARLYSSWIGRDSSSRKLVVVCAAAVGGIIVGGASVLGVAIALIQPLAHDAPAGSAVFDGQPHVVRPAPTVSSTTPQLPQPAAALPAAASTPTGDPQLVDRRRQYSDDDGHDVTNASRPEQYSSWDNFFGYSRNGSWRN
jgi:hypothetical protein